MIAMQDKVIIFDFDGTILDTSLATIPSCAQGAAQFGLPELPGEFICRQIGYASSEFYHRLYPSLDDMTVQRLEEHVEQSEEAYIRKYGESMLYAGIPDLLKKLKDGHFKLIIASTASLRHISAGLKAGKISEYFAEIHCDDTEKEQMVADIAAKHNHIEILIGDKKKDAAAARYSSIKSVCAGYGFGTEDEKELFDYRISEPIELIEIIGSLSRSDGH